MTLRFAENGHLHHPVGDPISLGISEKIGNSALRATNLLCIVSFGPVLLAQGKDGPSISFNH